MQCMPPCDMNLCVDFLAVPGYFFTIAFIEKMGRLKIQYMVSRDDVIHIPWHTLSACSPQHCWLNVYGDMA